MTSFGQFHRLLLYEMIQYEDLACNKSKHRCYIYPQEIVLSYHDSQALVKPSASHCGLYKLVYAGGKMFGGSNFDSYILQAV